jgi:hypothetical protein
MGVPLPVAVRDRIVACIRLAQAPGTPGEGEASYSAIGRIVCANADAVIPALSGPRRQPPPPPPQDDPGDDELHRPTMGWCEAARECLYYHEWRLSDCERRFLVSIRARMRGLTSRQADVLERIAAKCGVAIRWGW